MSPESTTLKVLPFKDRKGLLSAEYLISVAWGIESGVYLNSHSLSAWSWVASLRIPWWMVRSKTSARLYFIAQIVSSRVVVEGRILKGSQCGRLRPVAKFELMKWLPNAITRT